MVVGGLLGPLLTGCWTASGPTPPGSPASPHDLTVALAAGLEAAWRAGDARAARDLADPAADGLAERLAATADNAGRLALTDLAVSVVPGPATGWAETWEATLRVDWRIGGLDDAAASALLPVTIRAASGGARLAGLGRAGERQPLWLTGPLRVVRGQGWLVLVRRGSPAPLAAAARAAVRTVGKVLAPRPLVVELPLDEAEFERTVGARPGEYASLAALTTTADGSARPEAPPRVVVNPVLVASLGVRGLRLVVAHEAAHVAAGAVASRGPLWLSEGFADYVALGGVGDRGWTSAARATVRSSGLPGRLPTDAQFTGEEAQAAYEMAWLACRVIAEGAGEDALVRLQAAVAGGRPVRAMLPRITGWSRRELLRRWWGRLSHLPA